MLAACRVPGVPGHITEGGSPRDSPEAKALDVVRRGGLEPPYLIQVLDPKSSASANSATFASDRQPGTSLHGLQPGVAYLFGSGLSVNALA